MTLRRSLLLTLVVLVFSAAVFARYLPLTPTRDPGSLTSYAPPGALLTLEAPDFRRLLGRWTSSPEETRWLKSDDYAAFSRSRLFGRLKDAQDEFAASAGLAPDARFLSGVAGRQSLFAWYDIGKLEFLYITRMPPGEAAKTPLLRLRGRYEQRSVAGTTFYVRTAEPAAVAEDDSPAAQGTQDSAGSADASANTDEASPDVSNAASDPARTVAFAVRGDFLLLATREDLLAEALQLMAHPAPGTLAHEDWYASAQAPTGPTTPDLHMTLNLAKLVPSPYFRSYWVQGNISEMKRYRAAVSDLVQTPEELRETRLLLPQELIPANSPAQPDPASANADVDLGAVLAYLPPGSVYRATAKPSADLIVDALGDKLLARLPAVNTPPSLLPTVALEVPLAGTPADLEQRIDQPLTTPGDQSGSATDLAPLRAELARTLPTSMLVLSQPAGKTSAAGVFQPVHTAVVLATDGPTWHPEALQARLASVIASRLTVEPSSLTWEAVNEGSFQWKRLRGYAPLALAIQGNVCVLASDEDTLRAALEAARQRPATRVVAGAQAGVDLLAARPALTRFAALLDAQGPGTANTTAAAGTAAGGSTPPFFSGNLGSLGEAFRDLASETFTQTTTQATDASRATVRQEVVYRWRAPGKP